MTARPLRILLLCSAFNGLTQRAWVELREAGHVVVVVRATGDDRPLRATAAAFAPELILCPFLRERIPQDVWSRWPTVVIHPGPRGDRGPSSLDWAIAHDVSRWGVTALQAVQEMDAGPVWAHREFPMPPDLSTKSALYNGVVTDAALELVHEVVGKAADPTFQPVPLDYTAPGVWGCLQPTMRQADRAFDWSDPSYAILHTIRGADGSPGVHTRLCDQPVAVFDAHLGPRDTYQATVPGTVVARRHGAVLVATGEGTVWIGHLRARAQPGAPKLPATQVLGEHIQQVPRAEAEPPGGYSEISYRREGPVGIVSTRFYNGAMSTGQCQRLFAALLYAVAQDTRVLLLRGGRPFSNGIHLGVIEAAPDPAAEAWANINAIDDVCAALITCVDQLVVCSMTGNAGAGGVMLALGADRVLLRAGVVLNPHYAGMGLYGSEYWTYVLPARVGPLAARRLTTDCDPIGAGQAVRMGLADGVAVGGLAAVEWAAQDTAYRLATSASYPARLAAKRDRRAMAEAALPLHVYRGRELTQMHADLFGDRNGFADRRRAFITKRPAAVAESVHA